MTIRIYLNAACYYPTTILSEELGPACLPASIGRTTPLPPLVTLAYNTATSGHNYQNLSNATVENVHMTPLRVTIAPFLFYLLGMLEMALLLMTIPVVFCAGNFALVFHVGVCASAFVSNLIGMSLLIA